LERAFLQLTVQQRAALVLTHYVGLSPAEVSQIMGVPVGTVYSRLHYGSRAMRAVIAGTPEVPAATPEPGR
jgi:RNA polymerase sigma-70 factor (ECF subfamily)